MPTKVCSGCKLRLPWDEFYVKARWPDGTTRQPHARCKRCHARTGPGRRAYWREYRRRERKDAARWERELALQRTRRKQASAERRREGKPLLPAGPFAEWLRTLGDTNYRIAKRTGLHPEAVRTILRGTQDAVSLDAVDRASLLMGVPLAAIYPDI